VTRKPSKESTAAERPERPAISRRDLLKSAGAAGAAALIPIDAPDAETPRRAAAAQPSKAASPPPGPLMSLTARETEILSAMVDRLIPSDDMGPGALEAGALRYIDRALSGPDSDAVEAYRAGLAALDRYAGSSRGAPFLELSDQDKDAVLLDVELGEATGVQVGFLGSSAAFFNMVKSHTWQGTFGDPTYGGNVDFIGWDLLGYPGVRMRVGDEDQRLLEEGALPPARRSAYDFGPFQLIRGEQG
jgi:gluconate 2-dehydrogenase gamma chain